MIPQYPTTLETKISGRDKDGKAVVPKFPGEEARYTFTELDNKVVEQEKEIKILSERLDKLEANAVEVLGRSSNTIIDY